jgi:hypothetical protein
MRYLKFAGVEVEFESSGARYGYFKVLNILIEALYGAQQ